MKFLHTRNGTILLGAVAGAIAVGYLMKQARAAAKDGKDVKETWAYKIGLVG